MKNESQFRDFLKKEGRTDNVINSYLSYVRTVEEKLGSFDDIVDKLIEDYISKKVSEKTFKKVQPRKVSDYRSGIRAYWRFIKGQPKDTKD